MALLRPEDCRWQLKAQRDELQRVDVDVGESADEEAAGAQRADRLLLRPGRPKIRPDQRAEAVVAVGLRRAAGEEQLVHHVLRHWRLPRQRPRRDRVAQHGVDTD
jgi:hypothetical protein